MFSQHPFTLEHRYSLDALPALPVWKRALDILVSIAALPLLASLTFVFTLIANFCSRGPVFYREVHSGYMGRPLRIYRFRTMDSVVPGDQRANGSEEASGKASALIPGGRVLRATKLADLPQVLNVLRGEMSLVGPQPGLAVPGGQRSELHTVPGMTGPWRLQGDAVQDGAVARWDQAYAQNMSFQADVWILFRTILTMIFPPRTH